jgi:hypothetical protein
MSEAMKCKYCGAAANIKDGMIFGQCGTWEVSCNGVVYRNSLCERDALRKRIDAAVKALQDITRYEVDTVDHFGTLFEQNEHGEWVQWDDLANAVKILTGNS